jgi:hypothetical protein
MLIKIRGTKQGEQVYLEGSHGRDKPFVRLPAKPIKGTVYKVVHKVGEYEGQPTNKFALQIANGGIGHYFDMGGGQLAFNVINTLASATTEQLEKISLSFYTNKAGYNSVFITTGADENRIPWYITKEEKDSLIITQMVGKKEVRDDSAYVEKLIALIPEINARAPRVDIARNDDNLLDFLPSDTPVAQSQTSVAEEVFPGIDDTPF